MKRRGLPLLPLVHLLWLEEAAAAACIPGTHTDACTPCPSGYFSPRGVACAPCPEGSDSPPGAAACQTRCGWADAAAVAAATSEPTAFAMTSRINVVCPVDHFCPDFYDEMEGVKTETHDAVDVQSAMI